MKLSQNYEKLEPPPPLHLSKILNELLPDFREGLNLSKCYLPGEVLYKWGRGCNGTKFQDLVKQMFKDYNILGLLRCFGNWLIIDNASSLID